MPGWRNGIRGGLKIPCPSGRAGSTPAPGTNNLPMFMPILAGACGIYVSRAVRRTLPNLCLTMAGQLPNMRRVVIVFTVILASGGCLCRVVRAQDSVVGHWVGVASREGADLPVELDFRNNAKELKGSISIRTEGASGIALRNVSQGSTGSLLFEIPTDFSTFHFSGTVRGNSLTGSWNLFGFDSDVSMSRDIARPPRFVTQEVSCHNGNIALAATLLLPSRARRYPALVFVHGSGPGPRQEFNFLAEHFASLGVASVIYDKRGSGSSTGDWRIADFDDLAADALACVAMLREHKNISEIGIVGQSQGGWIAPLAASKSREVAFMVLISGTPVTPARQGWWNTEFTLREDGFKETDIEEALLLKKMDDDVTRTGQGLGELETAIERAKSKAWYQASPFVGTPEPMRQWYRRIMDFDVSAVLETLSIPSLWIYGGRDNLVPAAESAAILERLRERCRDISVRTFSTADHALWVRPPDGKPFQWPGLAPGYLDFVGGWLLRHVNAKRRRQARRPAVCQLEDMYWSRNPGASRF